jgi:hypothetical protein
MEYLSFDRERSIAEKLQSRRNKAFPEESCGDLRCSCSQGRRGTWGRGKTCMRIFNRRVTLKRFSAVGQDVKYRLEDFENFMKIAKRKEAV